MYYLFIFLIFSFVCYSGTQMIVYMRGPFAIFEKFREVMEELNDELGELLGCEYCTSTWFSLFVSLFNLIIIPSIPFTPFNLILEESEYRWLSLIFDCLLGSGITWMLFRVEDALIAIKERNQQYEDGK